MVAPTAYDVTILVNDVDVTDFTPYRTMSIQSYPRRVSTFRFTVENPTGVTPARDHSVKVTWDSGSDAVQFLGFITQVRTVKQDNGFVVNYECEASDYKILLARSVMEVAELTGTDTDILSDLLTNGYPDLSSFFNFTSGVTSIGSNLTLPTGNQSILTALNQLADLTGADWSFTDSSTDTGDLITFDTAVDNITVYSGSESPGAKPWLQHGLNAGASLIDPVVVSSGGNPDDCVQWNPTTGIYGQPLGPNSTAFKLNLDLISSGTKTVNNVKFDIYVSSDVGNDVDIAIRVETTTGQKVGTIATLSAYDTWISIDANVDTTLSFPYTMDTTDHVRIDVNTDNDIDCSTNTVDIRFDNVIVEFATPLFSGADTSVLNWDDTPPAADFNFNIDTSDEFGFDFDFTQGDFDDFNSVTVVGGREEVSIDWTYPNQDGQLHINLETAVKNLAVFKNTGSEGTPTWTAQTVGEYGKDTLGTVDVNYDPVHHWLYFNTAPSDFYDAIRVTGEILRPIRVRLEDIDPGEQTKAVVIENEDITSESQAVALANTKLSKRKAVKNLNFKTHEPGLYAGQNITVTDTPRGLAETLQIQAIRISWQSPALGLFDVECGTDEATGVDMIIANNDKRSRDNQLSAGSKKVVADFYTDDSDELMTDDSNNSLYETT